MSTKSFKLVFILILALSIITACSSNNGGNNNPPNTPTPAPNNTSTDITSDDKPEELEKFQLTMGYNLGRGVVEHPSLWEKGMEEKWGLTFEWIDFAGEAFAERANILFATDEYPDWFYRAPKALVDQWAKDDFLYDYSSDWSKLPNFRAMFNDEQWEEVLRRITSPNGGVYYLPRIDARSDGKVPITLMWNYKKSAWDELGLEFPHTTDELYEALKVIKEKDPNAVPIPGRWDITGATYGFVNAFRTNLLWYTDPDNNGEYSFGPIGDKFRDMLKYINKLYAEGMLDKEFLTQTDDQWKQDVGSGSAYVQFGTNYYHQFNTLEEGVEWTYAPHYIRAYEGDGMGPLLGYGAGVQTYGPVITDKATPEERDRLLAYIDWTLTREGLDFQNYGIEGETYIIDTDGSRVPTENINDNYVDRKDQKDLVSHGFGYMLLLEYQPRDIANNPWIKELTENMNNDKDAVLVMNPSVTFNEDEQSQLADIQTMVEDTRNRYIAYFIMGDRDPNNDAHWTEYLNALNSAGYEKYAQIHKEAYTRIYK